MILSGILRGVVDLILKGFVGDVIDKTHYDRRNFLAVAAVAIALSSLMVFFVNGSDTEDKMLVYVVRSIESVALAFLGPVFNAITLSAFGPEMFDQMQVKKELVSHAGSFLSAILSSVVAWVYYPNIEYVFLLPTLFAVSATYFVRYIPRGDPLMGRGFHLHTGKRGKDGCVVVDDDALYEQYDSNHSVVKEPEASSYRDVFTDKRIVAIIAADVFHVIAEANVGLIFNETLADVGTYSNGGNQNNYNNGQRRLYNDMAVDYDEIAVTDEAIMSREAIPLLATAGSMAQIVMIAGTVAIGYLTARGWGRKPFYVAHLCVHPVRVILLILCLYTGASKGWLVSTELVGGLTGAFGIVNAFMRADIVFGSGRFNVVDGYQATIRGVAATSSQYLGGLILENKGPMTALTVSLVLAMIPPVIGVLFVPETLGMREKDFKEEKVEEKLLLAKSMDEIELHTRRDDDDKRYVEMSDPV